MRDWLRPEIMSVRFIISGGIGDCLFIEKLRIYNAAFIPMLTYGMESASLSQRDLHRLEAFHSKALRKMRRMPATFYTKILEPTLPATANQQLKEQTSQPPLTHHIHKAQLKLFGHHEGAG